MKAKVMEISTISHLSMKDGVPCDNYTATISLRVVTQKAVLKYYYIVIRRTMVAVQKEIDRYELWETYDFDPAQLTKAGI